MITNMKLDKMKEYLQPSPSKNKLQSPTKKEFNVCKNHIEHLEICTQNMQITKNSQTSQTTQ